MIPTRLNRHSLRQMNRPRTIPYGNPDNPARVAARTWVETGTITDQQAAGLRGILLRSTEPEDCDDRTARLAAVLLELASPEPHAGSARSLQSDPLTLSLKRHRNAFQIRALIKAGAARVRECDNWTGGPAAEGKAARRGIAQTGRDFASAPSSSGEP